MAIDTGEIYNRVMDAVDLAVGSDLHQITKEGVTRGAIFKSKDSRPTGKHPFVIVDIATRQLQGNWANARYYDGAGDLVTETIYDYFVTIAVYGGVAMDIAGNIESSFVREDINNIFCEDQFASAPETFPITSTTTRVENETMDFASFILKLTLINRVIEASDEINSINTDLKLRYPDSDDDLVSSSFTSPAP